MGKRKILATVIILTILVSLVSGCSVENTKIPKEYRSLFTDGSFDENMVWTCDDEKYSDFISELAEKCEASFEGSLLVATDEQVVFAGGFHAMEADGETKVNAFTTYEIGSLTKQFMAACILQQVQAGNIRTDETIDKYFPEFPYGSQITIDHLLHMDSGIVDYVNEPLAFFEDTTQFESFNKGELSDEEMLDFLSETNLKFEPGQKFAYSNTNYYLLALILEKVTGMTYEEYMSKNLFEPCGMRNSTNTEVGNVTSVPVRADYMTTGRLARGAGDIHSNVCDMLLWDRAIMNEKVIDSEQFQYMTQMRNGYSCGWMDAGTGKMFHGGTTMGYSTMNTILQVEEIGNVYVITMTANQGNTYATQQIINMIEDYYSQE